MKVNQPPAIQRPTLEMVAVLTVFALIFLAFLTSGRDVSTTVSIFSTRFLGIFIEATPFLLLGTLTSGLIEAFVSSDDIARWIPRKALPAAIAGAFMGFAFPVCECGVVPVVRRLFTKGLPMSVGITFLLAAPVMNPIVLASTYIAFGAGPILIGRFVITAVVAIAVGLLFGVKAKPSDVLLSQSLMSTQAVPVQRMTFMKGIRKALALGADEFFEMGRYLIIGTTLAAAMQTFISQDSLLVLGSGPGTSVWVMQILAFVLSVCSTVDAFLALAFAGTFSTGSILAFLTFGPMVDIKSMLMFLGVFERKVVAYLIILPLLITMLIGIWINLNLAI